MLLSVFIDLRKAFDTVPHQLILDKLEMLGVRGTELKWFRNYLSNQRQFVVLGKSASSETGINIGVQQGSLLGVLLFQLMINDISACLKFTSSILYADDTMLYIYGSSLRFLRLKMQDDLNNLSEWLHANGLKLNVIKTKSMLFSRDRISLNVDLVVENEPIEMVTYFKFLGIYLDQELNFEKQYQIIYNKLVQFIFIVRKLTKLLPLICLRSLYFAYFHSYLTYCSIVWVQGLRKQQQNCLYKLQKCIVRLVARKSSLEHCMPVFKKQ